MIAVRTAEASLSALVIEPARSGGGAPSDVSAVPRQEDPLYILRRPLTGRSTKASLSGRRRRIQCRSCQP